jgi:hypothetical protein
LIADLEPLVNRPRLANPGLDGRGSREVDVVGETFESGSLDEPEKAARSAARDLRRITMTMPW